LGSGTFTFSAFQNLTGGTGPDTFKLIGSAHLDGALDGGGGANSNTLDYSAYSARVVVSLGTNAVTAIKNLHGSGLNRIQSIVGSSAATNLLVSTNADTTFNVTGANAGNLNDAVIPGGTLSFSAFAFLTGGSSNDTYAFGAGGSLSGAID